MTIRPSRLLHRQCLFALAVLLALPGCVADPRLNAGVSVGAGGVHVYPSVSGRVGAARISVSP